MANNLQAFLDVIAFSEGTYGRGDDGYNVLVGGTLFDGYVDHPRKLVYLSATLSSTAAGRYQILEHMFDAYKQMLHLPDFGHESQDKIAVQLIHECKALPLVASGAIDQALVACNSRWASLPGSTYGQHTNRIQSLVDFYNQRSRA